MDNSPTIHVIGDSHTGLFSGSSLFTVHHIGPATAYNLGKENSSNKSLDKLLAVLNNIEKTSVVLLVFGEIDCRIHIYRQYKKNQEINSISELIDKTILNYGMTISEFKKRRYNLAIVGIVPVGTEENIYGYDYYASREIRSKIYREFNLKLRSFCIYSNLKYLDIYGATSDDMGYMLPEYTDDGVHLNSKILPFIEQWAMDEFKMKTERCDHTFDSNVSTNSFEIHDEEVNVEEIMKKIRENISKRKQQGTYPPEIDTAAQLMIPSQKKTIEEVADDLANLNINSDIQNNSYVISSHRPIVGKVLIKGREMVYGEVRRYVDPMIFKQITFNQSAAKVLNNAAYRLSRIEKSIGEIDIKDADSHCSEPKSLLQQLKESNEKLLHAEIETDERLFQIEDRLEALKKQISDEIAVNRKMYEMAEQVRNDVNILLSQLKNETKERNEEIRKENEESVRSLVLAMGDDIEKKAWLARILDEKIAGLSQTEKLLQPPHLDTGVNYFVFEEKFRGSREDIAQRQTAFLRYFEGCKNVLDIGCGRGEFLEAMSKHGIGARGVDLDEIMVDFCRSKGLEVELEDAFEYLEKLDDASLDGIFIDQVVEHLEPAYLVRLLKLCFQKLKYGFYLIAETVNPLSFSSFANFYIDLTHIKPVHPETLKFLLESTGFREVKPVFSSPLPETMRLQRLGANEGATDVERHQTEIYNRNIEMLNATLYGAQDYAMIGKK